MRFAIGPVPVRIHVSFLLVALFGWNAGFTTTEVIVWTAVVFVSVLGHELGHAFTARRYEAEAAVTLFALGGVTRWIPTREVAPGERFVIAAAGSFVEVVPALVLYAVARTGIFGRALRLTAEAPPWEGISVGHALGNPVAFALGSFVFVSLVWGLFNWLPIKSLDGYHMLGSFLEGRMGDGAAGLTRSISVVVAAISAYFAWRYGFTFAAIFIVILAATDVVGGASRVSRPG